MSRLVVVPLGEVSSQLSSALAKALKPLVDLETRVEMSEPEPLYAYNPKRRQYSSTMILERLKSASRDSDIVLGVTSVDLFVPDLSFVFGEAEVSGRVAVISIARLRQEFYDLPPAGVLLAERTRKEAIHELGHVLGLPHCPISKCIMHFSTDLDDTDYKSENFCSVCRGKIGALK